MDKMIIVYLESILRIFQRSKEKEESLDGLILQLAMLEKIKEMLTNTISRLYIHIDTHTKKELSS